jgi:hypothetical protein
MTTPERIAQMVHERAARGLEKYGVTVDRKDLTLAQWVRHAQEELLDAPQYLQRVLETFREEIEKAYREGFESGLSSDNDDNQSWTKSRARRVAEGGE